MLSVQPTTIQGLLIIEPQASYDVRGLDRLVFHPTEYAAFGITGKFASDRHVRSFQGALRGLYLLPEDQHMLFNIIRGDVCLVVVDVRVGSRQFGKIQKIDITEAQNRQVYIPGGLAYGYCVTSDVADIHEKYTGFYDAQNIQGIFWKDADLNIEWPVRFPLIAETDAHFPSLRQLMPACV